METEHPKHLHPANAEELANIAEETGADVLCGPLRYPSYSGGWQLGDIDFSEYMDKYCDHEIVVIIASVGKAREVEPEKYVCGICGFAMTELGECPRCKLQRARTARGLKRRMFLSEISRLVEEKWNEPDAKDGSKS